MLNQKGFTLAEVLITLAIVGVVAALTLPTLIANINDKVNDNAAKVFNAKMIKGLNLTKTAGDLNSTYSSTYDFLVNGLSKNLKMAKICDNDHLTDCIPYSEIKYETSSGKEKTVKVKDLTTGKNLNLDKISSNFVDTAAFVLGDGTPVIVSYKKDCLVDTEELDKSISSCLAGLYDINGSRKPNKYINKTETVNGKEVTKVGDLRGFNSAYIGSSCMAEPGGVCLVTSASNDYTAMLAAIQEKDPSYTQSKFHYISVTVNDNWKLAGDYCSKVVGGSLPSEQQLADIANALYGGKQDGSDYSKNDREGVGYSGKHNISNIPDALTGIGTSWDTLWSSSEIDASWARGRTFGSTFSRNGGGLRHNDYKTVCVGE